LEDVPVSKKNRSITILAVDDDFDILSYIRQFLQKHSFNVFGFTDPLLALEHFKINCNIYDMILSDVRMPGMNGFEFVKMLREINPKVIVLLMSAFDSTDYKSLGLSQDDDNNNNGTTTVDGFLQKPFTGRELINSINFHFDKYK
jgi:DNA-binding response OmpR family regulator